MAIFNNKTAYTPISSPRKLANHAGLSFYDHNVLVKDPDPYSLASLILLQRGLHSRRNSNWLHKASRTRKRTFMRNCFAKGNVFCFKCKIKLVQPNRWQQNGRRVASVDHIIPIDENPDLARDTSNFRMACQRCNCGRH